jgi:hypothetical protein
MDNIQTQLRVDFPPESMSADTSRGFELTSIKAMYIIERLNDVFGLCGYGWRYVHSTPYTSDTGEIVLHVAVQYRINENGIGPIYWNNNEWTILEYDANWSNPIFAFGGKKPLGKGGSPYVDSLKSALTDGLTKAASLLGVGTSVFKGQANKGPRRPSQESAPKKADATQFYLAQKQKYGTDVPQKIKDIASEAASGKITWDQAIKQL